MFCFATVTKLTLEYLTIMTKDQFEGMLK